MEKIILIGGGGHCKSVMDSILRQGKFEIYGIVDCTEQLGSKICGYEIEYTDADLEYLYTLGITNAFITVGGIGDCSLRQELYNKAKKLGFSFPIVCDPSAVVSKSAVVGEGTFIGKSSVINALANIKEMAIINTATVVEHDCIIGAFAAIAPSTTLSGGVHIGDYTHLGTGTSVIENIKIGNNSLIGAGSVVVKDISNHIKAYGNPCKEVAIW